jgi:hypothetical protein
VGIRYRGCFFECSLKLASTTRKNGILHAKNRWTFGIADALFECSFKLASMTTSFMPNSGEHSVSRAFFLNSLKSSSTTGKNGQKQVDIRYRRCFFKCSFKSASMTEKTASCLPNAGGHSVSRMLFLNALQCHLRLERSVSIFLHVFYFFEYIKF